MRLPEYYLRIVEQYHPVTQIHHRYITAVTFVTMPVAAQQWDPFDTLNIDKARTLCYGRSHSKGRDCHVLVAAANRYEAHRLLANMARHNPSSDDVLSKLNQIAHLLLCRNVRAKHQNQAATVVETWKGKIADVVEEIESNTNGPEELGDLRVEMAEAQRIVTRVATALSTHENRLLRFETSSSSATMEGDNELNQDISNDDLETIDSQTVEGDYDDRAESQPSQLNLDHVQALVRQLTLEHEEDRRRRIPLSNIRDANEAPVSAVTDSPRTVISASPEPQVDTSEDPMTRTEEPSMTPESTSSTTEEISGRFNATGGDEPGTSVSIPPQSPESAANEDAPHYATLDFSQSLFLDGIPNCGVNSGASHSLSSGPERLKKYVMPFWQAILFFYLGLLFATYFLQPSQQGWVRMIGPGWGWNDQSGIRAEQPMLEAPAVKSVVRM